MDSLSKSKRAGKTCALFPAFLLGLSIIGPHASAQDRDRLGELVLCSAVFNASVARTSGEELRNEYVQETVAYAKAALALADERGMTEQEFQTYAVEVGESVTIAESELAGERARCRSGVPVTRQ